MMRSSLWPHLALITLLACTPTLLHAQEAPSETPSDGIRLPDYSRTTQSNAYSVESNPAGLGFMNTQEFAYAIQLATPDAEGTVKDAHALFYGMGGGGFGLGFGAQWLTSPQLGASLSRYRKYTVAGAFGDSESFSLGIGYNFFGSDTSERLNDLSSVDLGLQWRLSQHVGISTFVRDVNAPFIKENQSLPRRYGAGFAVRAWDGRFIYDQDFTHIQDSEQIRVSPRLAIEPISGLRFFARGEWDVSSGGVAGDSGLVAATAGLELSAGFAGIMSGVHLQEVNTENKITGHTHSIWFSANKQRALFNLTEEWVMVDLNSPFSELPISGLFGPSSNSYTKLLLDLDRMSQDSTVKGVVLNLAGPGLGYAQAWELRQRMEALRAKGIKVVALLQSAQTKSVYLANGADKIFITPNTMYEPNGLIAQLVNYKGILKRFGINAEFMRVRDYKTAPEAYVYDKPSPQSLEQTGDYISAIFDALIQSFASRNKTPAQARAMVDHTPLMPLEAKQQGFVDGVLYPHELEGQLEKLYGPITLRPAYIRPESSEYQWRKRPEIAVVVIDGSIIQGANASSPLSSGAMTGSSTIVNTLQTLSRDSNVKAIVLRINSPGGSALASDIIYRELRRTAQRKPVIASMSNYAASGGYYVAAGADEIMATPITLTGSIGIFAGKFSVEKLTKEYGVNVTNITRGMRAGGQSILEPFSMEQRKALTKYLVYLYRLFLEQAAHTRPLTAEQIDSYGRGHVWTGTRAAEVKLIDSTGSLIDAIRRAEALGGIPAYDASVKVYPSASGGLGSGLLGVKMPASLQHIVKTYMGNNSSLMNTPLMQKHLSALERSVLLLLHYNSSEAVMMPNVAIDVR